MRRWSIAVVIWLCLCLLWAAHSQQVPGFPPGTFVSRAPREGGGGGGGGLALDGKVHGGTAGGTSVSVSLTTTSSNDIIVVIATGNGDITGVSGGGLTWTKRAANVVGVQDIEEWYAIAASPLTAASITVSQMSSAILTVDAFGISGANTSTIFDSNGVLPVKAGNGSTPPADPISISTSNANDFIISVFRMNSTISPTQGAGWTLLNGADYQLVEYQIVSATQSGLSGSIGTGVNDSNGAIGDAFVQ